MAKTIKIKVETVELTCVYYENDTHRIHTDTYPWVTCEETYEHACETLRASYDSDCTVAKIFKGAKSVDVYEIPLGTVVTHLNIAGLNFNNYRVD